MHNYSQMAQGLMGCVSVIIIAKVLFLRVIMDKYTCLCTYEYVI